MAVFGPNWPIFFQIRYFTLYFDILTTKWRLFFSRWFDMESPDYVTLCVAECFIKNHCTVMLIVFLQIHIEIFSICICLPREWVIGVESLFNSANMARVFQTTCLFFVYSFCFIKFETKSKKKLFPILQNISCHVLPICDVCLHLAWYHWRGSVMFNFKSLISKSCSSCC